MGTAAAVFFAGLRALQLFFSGNTVRTSRCRSRFGTAGLPEILAGLSDLRAAGLTTTLAATKSGESLQWQSQNEKHSSGNSASVHQRIQSGRKSHNQ